MLNLRTTALFIASFALAASSCGGSGGGKSVTLKGALKNMEGKKVAIAAKSKSGKKYQAKVDPNSKSFELKVPKGEPYVMAVNVDGTTKVVKFAKDKDKSKVGEAFDTEHLIADTVDIGYLDLEEGEILIGDDEGEQSIYEFLDSDGDGQVDWEDLDDDNDGKSDVEDDFDDIEGVSEAEYGDWGDDPSEWEGFFEAQETCGLEEGECNTQEEPTEEGELVFEVR